MIYDVNLLKERGAPAESLTDWMKCTTSSNLRDMYWLFRTFIDAYGIDVFWAYKDQQMQQKYGKTLTSSEKEVYINNMIADEVRFL